ncbi:UNVERIFIED_CONTAM: hypothetical protein Slati_0952400 [Sesamum latifolium]|uniref:Uncharacterized protein n=1 Tax=Sesamum latifolium TaxID=2727402 RepID=A0AAW2XPQ1_9LAMI
MIASVSCEHLAVLVPARVTTPFEVTVSDQADPALAIPRSNAAEGPATQLPTQVGDVPPQWPIGVSPKGTVGCPIPGDGSTR